MRRSFISAAAAVTVLLGALSGCGKADDSSSDSSEPAAKSDVSFAAGTTMEKLHSQGSIKIGVKYDQPGLAYKDPTKDKIEGFDAEIGRMIAHGLGLKEDQIEFIETVTKNRQPFIEQGTVDIVVASYSITPDRLQVIGMVGPYYITGQQLLVRKDDKDIKGPDDVKGKKVCSASGSTSIKVIEEQYGAVPAAMSTYTECIQALLNEQVDALTTDGSILMGYAAQDPDKLKVVGEPFSEEKYGIGYQKGDLEFCKFMNETLEEAYKDGTWEKAFEETLGKSGSKTPEPPKLNECA